MMPGIYENSNRLEGGKPRGKCWRLGGKNDRENEKREGWADGAIKMQLCPKTKISDVLWKVGKKRLKVQELIKRWTEGGGSEEKTAKQEKKFVKKIGKKKKDEAKRLFWLRQLVIRRIIIILKQRPYNSRSPGLICCTFNTTHALLSPFTLPQPQLTHNNNKKME